MANYHLAIQVISRGKGRQAVAAAAYRRAEKFFAERYDMEHDYSFKNGVVHSAFSIPNNAPSWLQDIAQTSDNVSQDFWNFVENFEQHKSARLSREIEFSLPVELSQEQNIELARCFIEEQLVGQGMVADWSVHWDNPENPHVHCMLTLRPLAEEGFGAKKLAIYDEKTGEVKRDGEGKIKYARGDIWGSNANILMWREQWAKYQNFHLAMHGHEARVDHRSYKDQGIEIEPTNKIGMTAFWMKAKGMVSERVEKHEAIKARTAAQIAVKPKVIIDKIMRQHSAFSQAHVEREIGRYVDSNRAEYSELVNAVLEQKQVVLLGERDGQTFYSTKDMIDTEQSMMDAVEHMAEGKSSFAVKEKYVEKALSGLNDELAQYGGLSEQQQDGIRLLTEGQRVQLVTGVAGAGKTTILKGAREAWEQQGYRVRGVALSGIAAANMQDAGIEAQTIHSIEGQWKVAEDIMDSQASKPLTPKQQEVVGKLLNKKDVLVIDEAGMVGSRQMQRVLAEADRAGAKVVLVGDDAQLQSIEAGAAFRHIKERIGGVNLDEVRRQREAWQREATLQFSTYHTTEALDKYIAHGDIQIMDNAKGQLVDDYMASYQNRAERSRIVLAYTREDVKALNHEIQARLQGQGRVGSIAHSFTVMRDENDKESAYSEQFATGDRVMFRKNDKELGVMNGTLGTIGSISSGGNMNITLDDGNKVRLNVKEYNQLQLGYAATVHKSQGVTVDESYILASRHFDRHTTYVAMSRHRFKVKLYADRSRFANLPSLKHSLSSAPERVTSLDFAKQRGIKPAGLVQRAVQKVVATIGSITGKEESRPMDKEQRLADIRHNMMQKAVSHAEASTHTDGKEAVRHAVRAAILCRRAVNLNIPEKGVGYTKNQEQIASLHDNICQVAESLEHVEQQNEAYKQEIRIARKRVANAVLSTEMSMHRIQPEQEKEQSKGKDQGLELD